MMFGPIAQPMSRPIHMKADVHEHRAPTDESVRLLNEMQEKAKADLIEVSALPFNGIEGVLHVDRDYSMRQFVMTAHFKLNGKARKVVVRENADGWKPDFRRTMIAKLRDAVAKEIANTLLIDYCWEGVF